MNRKSVIAALTVVVLATVLVTGGLTLAKRGGGGKPIPGGCPWKDMSCPDVYDPVTCDNGVTYPNACYAFINCATGCSDGGAAF